MSQTAITLAFEQHLAELQLGGQPVVPDEFVLAYIPGLDLLAPINRAAGLPPAGQIVHRQPVDQRGKVNANGVAYSIIMDTRVGDFTFNAMYLVHKASGMVAMVVHKADEDKLANQGDTQPGNSLVKSMLMEYQGAAEATNTQVDAGTWQIDFTARLLGLDEDIRLQALDHYGTAAFIDGGFAVTPGQGVNEFLVAPGLGYIAGLRAQLPSQQSVVVAQRPATLYADVYHVGTLLSDWHTQVAIKASSTPLSDYTDEAGYPHYVVPIASLAANGAVTDLRGRGGLWWHEHRSQAHTKEQVGLDKLENWSWSHSHTDGTGGATRYASGKAVADAYNALNSSKLDKTGTAVNAEKLDNQLPAYYLAWGNFTGVPATASRWPSFAEVTDKPATYPPGTHSHMPNEVGLELVGNYPMATQAEAEDGTSLSRYMSPVRVRQAYQKFGLGTHGVNNKVTDLNNILESGWYGSVTTTLNIPIASDGVVLHSSWTASSGGRASQIYFASNIHRSFIRHKGSGGAWGEWGEMAHTGNMQASLLENGYQKLPSGLILQWGVFAGGLDEPVSITFPIAFPNAAFNVSLSIQQVTYPEMQADHRLDVGSLSPITFGVTRPGTPTNIHGFYWSAIGH